MKNNSDKKMEELKVPEAELSIVTIILLTSMIKIRKS